MPILLRARVEWDSKAIGGLDDLLHASLAHLVESAQHSMPSNEELQGSADERLREAVWPFNRHR
jgi:HPt (histidine-containing phosphotransfer) domain-containing protein